LIFGRVPSSKPTKITMENGPVSDDLSLKPGDFLCDFLTPMFNQNRGSTPQDPLQIHLSTEDGVFKDHNASARPEDVLRMPARIVPLGMNKNCEG
jgi:hypothetical protein